MFNVDDFEARAREVLEKKVWNFYSSGAGQEQTLRENVEAYSR